MPKDPLCRVPEVWPSAKPKALGKEAVSSSDMRPFRGVLDDLELDEVHLSGRPFTWMNGRDRPTLERLDRAFASVEWVQSNNTPVTSYDASRLTTLITHR